jgi:hypothetical protein|nr:MAG TPA: hypothetical protein [Caudoviricetes sp.]
MINCVPKFVAGPPPKLIPGQFLLYESGEYALVGSNTAITSTQKIVKHTTLIEAHELEWLQSMAVQRSLGVLK